MPGKTAEAIAGAIKEGLSLWKTFIETRQAAYNRKMDKHKQRAINIAEQSFEEMSNLFTWLMMIKLTDKQFTQLNEYKTKIYRLKTKFNKYD